MDVSRVRAVERRPAEVTPARPAERSAEPDGSLPDAPHRPPVAPPFDHVVQTRRRAAEAAEAIAERAAAGFARSEGRDAAAALDSAGKAEELWIPSWVRVQYAARARKGWFLPAPTDLAGYGEEDDAQR